VLQGAARIRLRTSQPARPSTRLLYYGRAAWRWRPLEIDWQETDPEKVLVGAPDQGKAQALIRLYEKVTTRT
jgi:hypothetical protein